MNKLAEKIRVDIVRFDANTIERDLTEAAAELDRLTRELADARAVDVHSCHDKCTMPGCVNRRLRAEVAGLREQVQHLQSLLVDADNICKEHGGCDLQDCIDNDGDLYQSQAMADALDAARKGEA